MPWHAPHEGRQGRPPVFSSAAVQVCLSIKVPFKQRHGEVGDRRMDVVQTHVT